MSIILDALRKAEEEKKLQQPSPEIDIKGQILNKDETTRKGRPAPVNKAVLAGFVLAITGLAALGIYSSVTALRKEKPVEEALETRVAAPSPTVAKTAPAQEEARVAPTPAPTAVATPSSPPPAQTAPAPSVVAAAPAPTVVATPASPPSAKTAPAPSVVAAAHPPAEKATPTPKVAEKTPSKAVFGPPDVDTQHQVIPNQGASFALEGIIFHLEPDKRLAIMRVGTEGNEATVRIGDSLGTWLVKDIELDKVTFADHAKRIVLKID
ncbi:MAG: hypothetical protein HY098_07680 [Nitrospinae bacterium]|nr:hypothetical protein [Nitrospinota bacterium]